MERCSRMPRRVLLRKNQAIELRSRHDEKRQVREFSSLSQFSTWLTGADRASNGLGKVQFNRSGDSALPSVK